MARYTWCHDDALRSPADHGCGCNSQMEVEADCHPTQGSRQLIRTALTDWAIHHSGRGLPLQWRPCSNTFWSGADPPFVSRVPEVRSGRGKDLIDQSQAPPRNFYGAQRMVKNGFPDCTVGSGWFAESADPQLAAPGFRPL